MRNKIAVFTCRSSTYKLFSIRNRNTVGTVLMPRVLAVDLQHFESVFKVRPRR
jgi:hypothetical protein